jgi:hypothetical protein
MVPIVFRYFLSKRFNIGVQEKRELINVRTTFQPKEMKQDDSVFKWPMLPGEMPRNSLA